MTKKYLIINSHSPATDFFAEESLEFILTLASLEYEFAVLFLDDSSYQLLKQASFATINRNLLAITLQSCEFFALKNIYIEQSMLNQLKKNGLFIKDGIDVAAVDINDLSRFYSYYDIVMWY